MKKFPKIIHYCWFGANSKPDSVKKYIESWRIVLPDYEIIEWNESNFDINICEYTKQAYENKKFAFVSDYARLFALYHHGGIYLDTDVEICNEPNHLIQNFDVIFGFEELNFVATSTILAQPKSDFIEQFMLSYHERQFISPGGKLDLTTNVENLTNRLLAIGLERNNKKQVLTTSKEVINVLPQEYLSPFDYINLIDNRTSHTITVHHYGNSWGSRTDSIKKVIKNILIKFFGKNVIKKLRI
nr:glycosyltransferase [uncultured Vibrio sp.]